MNTKIFTASFEGVHTMIWGNLLHLGYNMWGDWDNPKVKYNLDYSPL